MTCHCAGCYDLERHFDARSAGKDLQRYREHGADSTTRMLIDALRTALGRSNSREVTLLDVGAGIGVIHHELVDANVSEAVHVDAAPAYVEAAREETGRRHHQARVRFVVGDFVAISDAIEAADLVTLDRVICCYADMDGLVRRSAEKARSFYGAVYPRRDWWVRAMVGVQNGLRRLKGSPFRTFLHSPKAIANRLREVGLEPVERRRTLVWEVVVFRRETAESSSS
ncbi:MAG: class I SAM-dependent methyltransferase [Gemmatimonadota bacterium]